MSTENETPASFWTLEKHKVNIDMAYEWNI